MTFQAQPLVQQKTVAEMLQQARRGQSTPLKTIAAEIHVSAAYLEALEHGRYNDLPAPVYIRQYLRLYCEWLGLSWESVQKLFEQEIQVYYDTPTLDPKPSRLGFKKPARIVARRSIHNRKPLLISNWLRWGAMSVVASLLLSYFAWSIIHLLSPPPLNVDQPTQNSVVTQQQLTIRGESIPQARVMINDQVVPLGTDGQFESVVLLTAGLNTIRITATTKQSRPRVITRYVLYQPPLEPADSPPSPN